MDLLKKVFWALFIAAIAIILIRIGPIYYKAHAIKGLCKEHADIYHRYSSKYIKTVLNEELDKLGIPRNQREIALSKTKEKITLEIYYEDEANFFDYYKKDFFFLEECSGVLDSVIAN